MRREISLLFYCNKKVIPLLITYKRKLTMFNGKSFLFSIPPKPPSFIKVERQLYFKFYASHYFLIPSGHYNISEKLTKPNTKALTSMFSSGTKRDLLQKPHPVPGPGTYKPHIPVTPPKKMILP